jgi:tripeptidyl-peptidase I
LGPNSTIFSPAWPNSCPYITNVGATKVYPGRTVFGPESAVIDPAGYPYTDAFSSGGGFSNIYPVPDYQKDAVDDFFAKHMPPYPYYYADFSGSIPMNGGLYNRIGCGYPGVAANGDNIATYVNGDATLEGGTSASTPIFASIVNRINEERIARGKNPVGFINPTLCKNPQVLNDIANGTNPGCCTVGFSAVGGWDPVSGLGTPNYPKMLDLFLSLS